MVLGCAVEQERHGVVLEDKILDFYAREHAHLIRNLPNINALFFLVDEGQGILASHALGEADPGAA